MKELPIPFKTEMVQAILEGRKTQTRRIIKTVSHGNDWVDMMLGPHNKVTYYLPEGMEILVINHARYQAGDHLYVKETYCPVDDTEFGGNLWVDYRATPKYSAEAPAGWDNAPDDDEALKWKSSMFMPKKYARIWIEVLEVRAERLQSMSEEDAKAEGVWGKDEPYQGVGDLPTDRFHRLWNSINGKTHPWESNCYVWVYRFKRLA